MAKNKKGYDNEDNNSSNGGILNRREIKTKIESQRKFKQEKSQSRKSKKIKSVLILMESIKLLVFCEHCCLY